MSKRHWFHEGVFYGDDGKLVGTYYVNDDGWWCSIRHGRVEQAKSRAEAIRRIEAAATTPPTNEGSGTT